MKPIYRFWKPEAKKITWTLFQDTPANLKKAMKKGAMFKTWNAFDRPYQENGEPDMVRFGDLPLDFDHESKPSEALKDLKTLVYFLVEMYGLDPYAIEFFVSGQKGFHASIPAELLGATAGNPMLPLIYKSMVAGWKEQLNLKTLDMALYNMGKGRMFRLPNVKRLNGKYKVPITTDEVLTRQIDDLIGLTTRPRTIERAEFDLGPVSDLSDLYNERKLSVRRENDEARAKPKPIKDLPKELAPCIRYILGEGPKTSNTNFNKIVTNLAAYLYSAGYSYDDAADAARDFLVDYEHSTAYRTPDERLKHFDDQWAYISKHEKYQAFECKYILGLGFPGSAFECDNCPVKADTSPPAEPPPAAKSQKRAETSSGLIRDYVDSLEGKFTTRDIYLDLGITDTNKKAYVRTVLSRLQEQGIIERYGNDAGYWRKVKADLEKMDLMNVNYETVDLSMPLDLSSLVKIMPSNIITLAGDANAGKTAFLLNMVKDNVEKFKVHYFSSEMAPEEMRMRIDYFDDFPLNHPNFNPYERGEDFADVIQPGRGNLNIIDFLEIVQDFWIVGKYLKEIHDKLKGAIAVVAIQKRHPGSEDALGGKRWLEKARLALSMSGGKLKIIKAKNWASSQNPNRLMVRFKLVNASKFIRQGVWGPDENDK